MKNFKPDLGMFAWQNVPQRILYTHIGSTMNGEAKGTISNKKRFIYPDKNIVVFYSFMPGIGSKYYPLFIRIGDSEPSEIDNEMTPNIFDKMIKQIIS